MVALSIQGHCNWRKFVVITIWMIKSVRRFIKQINYPILFTVNYLLLNYQNMKG